jgi:hypothetical protein
MRTEDREGHPEGNFSKVEQGEQESQGHWVLQGPGGQQATEAPSAPGAVVRPSENFRGVANEEMQRSSCYQPGFSGEKEPVEIYFKKLAHTTVEAGKSEIYRAGSRLETCSGAYGAVWKQNFFLGKHHFSS